MPLSWSITCNSPKCITLISATKETPHMSLPCNPRLKRYIPELAGSVLRISMCSDIRTMAGVHHLTAPGSYKHAARWKFGRA